MVAAARPAEQLPGIQFDIRAVQETTFRFDLILTVARSDLREPKYEAVCYTRTMKTEPKLMLAQTDWSFVSLWQ